MRSVIAIALAMLAIGILAGIFIAPLIGTAKTTRIHIPSEVYYTVTTTMLRTIAKTTTVTKTILITITKSVVSTVYKFVTVTPIPTTITTVSKSELFKEIDFKILNWSIELDKKRGNVYLIINYRTKKPIKLELYGAYYRRVYKNGTWVSEPYPGYGVDYTILNPELTYTRFLLAQRATVNGTYFLIAKYNNIEILRLRLDLFMTKPILIDTDINWIKNIHGNYDAKIVLTLANPGIIPIAIKEIIFRIDGIRSHYGGDTYEEVLWLEPKSVKKISVYCPFNLEPDNYYNLKIYLELRLKIGYHVYCSTLTLYIGNVKTPP